MKNLGHLLGALALALLCACSANTSTARVTDPGPATSPSPNPGSAMTPAADSAQSAAPAERPRTDCSNVRCAGCPEGQTPALTPPDCCKCVMESTQPEQDDCSAVRCAACPQGQRPALTPPDCCKCVPGMETVALPF